MPHISATRLRVRKLRYLIAFMRASGAVAAQLRASPGFLAGRTLIEARFTFWTVTAWDSGEHMRGFRDSGAHGAVMAKLMDWSDEAAVAHWLAESPAPDWEAIHARLAAEGRPVRLRHASRRHDEYFIPPPRPFLPESVITPAPG